MPAGIAQLINRRYATLHELQTVYGTEDYYNLLEIAAVDAYNRRALSEPR